MPSNLKLRDSDTGESIMDCVKVPEGFSFQISCSAATVREEPDGDGYVSCIVSPPDARRLMDHIQEHLRDLGANRA